MILDDKKIEEAAFDYNDGELTSDKLIRAAFIYGAKLAISEFLKDLLHSASEVPRNDNGKILAFSKEHGYRKLYDMNDELDKTTCDTYQEMWNEEVKAYHLTDWIFIDELFDLITKGGENEGA